MRPLLAVVEKAAEMRCSSVWRLVTIASRAKVLMCAVWELGVTLVIGTTGDEERFGLI